MQIIHENCETHKDDQAKIKNVSIELQRTERNCQGDETPNLIKSLD